MNLWLVIPLALATLAAPFVLYGLHRLCLWLEARGQLFYLNRQPEGGAGRSFVELQKALDPTTKHVIHVQEEKRNRSEEEAPGEPGCIRR